MKRKSLLGLLCLFLFVSCSGDDPGTSGGSVTPGKPAPVTGTPSEVDDINFNTQAEVGQKVVQIQGKYINVRNPSNTQEGCVFHEKVTFRTVNHVEGNKAFITTKVSYQDLDDIIDDPEHIQECLDGYKVVSVRKQEIDVSKELAQIKKKLKKKIAACVDSCSYEFKKVEGQLALVIKEGSDIVIKSETFVLNLESPILLAIQKKFRQNILARNGEPFGSRKIEYGSTISFDPLVADNDFSQADYLLKIYDSKEVEVSMTQLDSVIDRTFFGEKSEAKFVQGEEGEISLKVVTKYQNDEVTCPVAYEFIFKKLSKLADSARSYRLSSDVLTLKIEKEYHVVDPDNELSDYMHFKCNDAFSEYDRSSVSYKAKGKIHFALKDNGELLYYNMDVSKDPQILQ